MCRFTTGYRDDGARIAIHPKGNSQVKLQRPGYLAGIALTATLALTACGSDNNEPAANAGGNSAAAGNCASGTINAQGSSAQKNAMDEWIKTYQSACSGSTINYQSVGSGAGREAFIAKRTPKFA